MTQIRPLEILRKEELKLADTFLMKKAVVSVDIEHGAITLRFWDSIYFPITLYNAPLETLNKVAEAIREDKQVGVICRYNKESGNILFLLYLPTVNEPVWVGTLDGTIMTHYNENTPYVRLGVEFSKAQTVWLTGYPVEV
jgi:hypothetical protein